ncbi:FlaD/FlaE family flagellar protein [Halovenus rubra]|uniref:FlaD/FlaE family flagellar protein n=2 Tax=Halovenus rubra TaxID=869890 RepID=A0ABD5X758_9EURY|nr:FlaD/FlaE family flagellar protein [Halovenus rubra]
MSINPSDYDLNELRKMARERGGEAGEGTRDVDESDIGLSSGVDSGTSSPGDATSSFRAGLYRELLPLEAQNDASKPYLNGLPEHYAAENLIFEWLEFLILHAGYQGAIEALDYYSSVEWITDDCASTLNDYMLGLGETANTEGTELDIDDHLLSLVYIGKLASME